ncbi:MAG TPA: ABC transporter ATP-binding protein [Hyphomicrobium sp.]|nr:ABC transporter ATP-binding protein [Hyphomicrobium sp.]
MVALIEAKGLRKTFGAITAVDGISLSVKKGEVLGFLGPNGAGKSTTMKMITGFLEPDAGAAAICGHDVEQEPKAAKSKLGYLPEGAPAYGDMTPGSFLSFIAEIRGYRDNDINARVTDAISRAGLGAVINQRIETLSKGFKRRVGIAQAILHDPPVLIMDEPTDGLDPNQKHHVRELIREMAPHKAIIVSTHILEEVEAVCTRAVVIAKGRIVADGTAEELMRRAPGHGAVAIRVAAADADRISKALSSLAGVASVETTGKRDGIVDLRALPNGEAPSAKAIGDLLRRESLPFEEIYVERGKLDDVFRDITTSNRA